VGFLACGLICTAQSLVNTTPLRRTRKASSACETSALGVYEVKLVREGFLTKIIPSFEVNKPELTVLELELHALDEAVPAAMCPSGVPRIPCTAVPANPATPYPGVQSSSSQGASAAAPPESIPPDSANFLPNPEPLGHRHARSGVATTLNRMPHTSKDTGTIPSIATGSRVTIPSSANAGFFDFTGSSETGFDGRRLPVPSGLDSENPGSSGFFGRGEQALVAENLRLSFDLFRGDTSFRPVDFRVRFTTGDQPETSCRLRNAA